MAVFIATCVSFSCKRKNAADNISESKPLPDTLRVATLYSPGSYFIYREQPMGFDYDLITRFVEDKSIGMKLIVAPSLHRAIEMLDSNLVDIIAYEIPQMSEYRNLVIPCGPRNETHQVLVQPKLNGDVEISDVIQLPGHEVFVEANTKYLYRLQNLDEELGGGIIIRVVDNDTILTEDLIDMVATDEIPLTVADNDIAMINATYYPTLDVDLALSFPQQSAWAVAPANKWLADSIDVWLDTEQSRKANAELHRRYFEISKVGPEVANLDLSHGVISPYDKYFRKYAGQIGWDWRLLASQGYQESRFNPHAVSWAGAKGVMQIMPRTARAYGLSSNNMSNPEASISTSVKIIKDLDKWLAGKVPDETERKKFILAAYNGGIGHINDAIALAEKYGLDSTVWKGNVERALLMKSSPEYYNDPVVKQGYFRARETVGYVDKVMSYYERFKRHVSA